MREPPAAQRVDEVDLVEDELHRQLVGAEPGEDGVDRGDRLVEALVLERGVGDVEDEVREHGLLQCRGEPLDELVGQPADESRPCR